jgi:hypothetical protein
MTDPSSAAGLPSSNGKYIAVGVVLLLGIGGLLVWKLTADKPQASTVAAPTAPPTTTASYAPDDPASRYLAPPPREDPTTASSAPGAQPRGGGGVAAVNGGCNAKCDPAAGTAELAGALQVRAAQARTCYNQALSTDPTLKGGLSVSIRIAGNGAVCSAGVGSNSLQGAGGSYVATCVANMFRGGSYPPTHGGCADYNIPLSFHQ